MCLSLQASPYPLILSLENHCSVEQQAVMAKHLRTILGNKLLSKPLSDKPLKELPSPEVQNKPRHKELWLSHFLMEKLFRWSSLQELKGRILIKGKKHTPHLAQMAKTSSCASFSSSSDDELASSSKNTSKKDPAKVSSGGLVIKPGKLLTQTCQLIDQFSFMFAFALPRSVLNWAPSYPILWCTARASRFMAFKMCLKNHRMKCPPSLRVRPSGSSKTQVQQWK